MNTFIFVIKLVAAVILAVGATHLVLGVGADVMLGARLPDAVLRDPVLDSQNRFYGVAFTLYGVLLLLSATDLRKYRTVLPCVLAIFFAAGLARIVSIATHGMPSAFVLLLLASELLLPPLLWWWFARLEQTNALTRGTGENP
jgi:hypothetical protein